MILAVSLLLATLYGLVICAFFILRAFEQTDAAYHDWLYRHR